VTNKGAGNRCSRALGWRAKRQRSIDTNQPGRTPWLVGGGGKSPLYHDATWSGTVWSLDAYMRQWGTLGGMCPWTL
jgi:hypothetical protein